MEGAGGGGGAQVRVWQGVGRSSWRAAPGRVREGGGGGGMLRMNTLPLVAVMYSSAAAMHRVWARD